MSEYVLIKSDGRRKVVRYRLNGSRALKRLRALEADERKREREERFGRKSVVTMGGYNTVG